MNRDTLTGLAIGLSAGLLLGYFASASHILDSEATPAAVAATPDPAALKQLETQQRILGTEAALVRDPNNVQAWVALGNDCFDLHLSQKAVEAYGKALALAPAMPMAPDILTDQGVMYRELKDFDKAIADFKEAGKRNPQHVQSRYNLGVVYAQDKHSPAEALQAFNKVIELAPTSPQADLARTAIASLPR